MLLLRYTLNVDDGEEEEPPQHKDEARDTLESNHLPDWVPGAAERRNGDRKVLSGKQALMSSSIPLNLGLPMPTSSYQGSYIDPASQGQGFDPNKRGPGGSLNAHAMPTQCITGMAAAGAGKVNP